MKSSVFNRMTDYAAKSDMMSKHGAVLLKNGVPMAFSYNKIVGTKTMHAECDVIRRYLMSHGVRKLQRGKCTQGDQEVAIRCDYSGVA